jgi:antitoxin component of MazEF toxin-antitoxin module
MGYPTTVQLIDRKKTEQWYVNFPAAIARAMDFEKGEVVEWTIENKRQLTIRRKVKQPKGKKQK